jgi:hypothetical protein
MVSELLVIGGTVLLFFTVGETDFAQSMIGLGIFGAFLRSM